jgi:glycosyltransferase involved in cell wall biosynthesis
MDYFPNEQAMLWFCSAVWPKMLAQRPTLQLKIVGANPSRAVRRLGALEGVEVTGFVTDVRPHLQPAAVSIAPLDIARGMQNKVLECMAMGVPVVASPQVAAGLGFGSSSALRVARSAEDYVAELLTIVDGPEDRAERSAAARSCVEASFSWPRALEKLDSILGSLRLRPAGCGPSEGRSARAHGPTA